MVHLLRGHCAAGGGGPPPIIALPPIARPRRAYRALAAMGLDPLLHLGLRLGEGSGAAVAVPIVRGAGRAWRNGHL
jgi:hypothetical protein